VEQVLKWEKGNALWDVVMIEPSNKSTSLVDDYLLAGIPDQIKQLIHKYGNIF
jgi:hypothetical protein